MKQLVTCTSHFGEKMGENGMQIGRTVKFVRTSR